MNCPKCNGWLHTNRDIYGEEVACLQCGWRPLCPDPPRLVHQPKQKARARRPDPGAWTPERRREMAERMRELRRRQEA